MEMRVVKEAMGDSLGCFKGLPWRPWRLHDEYRYVCLRQQQQSVFGQR